MLPVMKSKLYEIQAETISQFIENTAASKKTAYLNVIKDYTQHGLKSTMTFEIFSKTNEVHLGNQKDDGVRPRLIFNPPDHLKVLGSYLSR